MSAQLGLHIVHAHIGQHEKVQSQVALKMTMGDSGAMQQWQVVAIGYIQEEGEMQMNRLPNDNSYWEIGTDKLSFDSLFQVSQLPQLDKDSKMMGISTNSVGENTYFFL